MGHSSPFSRMRFERSLAHVSALRHGLRSHVRLLAVEPSMFCCMSRWWRSTATFSGVRNRRGTSEGNRNRDDHTLLQFREVAWAHGTDTASAPCMALSAGERRRPRRRSRPPPPQPAKTPPICCPTPLKLVPFKRATVSACLPRTRQRTAVGAATDSWGGRRDCLIALATNSTGGSADRRARRNGVCQPTCLQGVCQPTCSRISTRHGSHCGACDTFHDALRAARRKWLLLYAAQSTYQPLAV